MEWAPLKYLFFNANVSVINLMISVTDGVSLWDKKHLQNMIKVYVYQVIWLF